MSLGFRNRVIQVVSDIPSGKVMSYGQVAALAGNPRAARVVGQIAHFGPDDVPWQRVVNKSGGLARGYTYGGVEGHKRDLEREGIEVNEYKINMDKYQVEHEWN